ncbi:hypothetical protein QVD17_23994 [Tagetes erecta]|uniref:K Homology domain-containing protein n=1 Tax=Tagetes erecta TaxID=13708 RepID=A0AAD8NUT2_TARER|nr:hypothetical protein QVD17_23994 [Tagetes erecta]
MEQNPNIEKYAKAKIEDPNLRLPKALLKFNTDPSSGELCYYQIFEDDLQKHKHLAEEIAAGAKLDRKVYRIRNMELWKVIGDEYEDMKQIHKVSKATIGLLVDSEADNHAHSFIDLVGTVEQVKMAEELILDKALKTYQGPLFPVILMPPTIHGHEIRLDVDRVEHLLGKNFKNVLALEVVTGAWFQVGDEPPADGPEYDRIVNIYGPKAHVCKALTLMHSQVFRAGECPEAEEELDILFSELSIDEVMESMKSRIPQNLVASGSGSGSASASASGSGSGQTEEQHVEDKDESKGKKLQQHEEEDVEEAVSGEASKPKGSVEDLD